MEPLQAAETRKTILEAIVVFLHKGAPRYQKWECQVGTDLLTWDDGKQIVPATPDTASMPLYELLKWN